MAELQHADQVDAAGAFLAQAGVKGMKWGVQRQARFEARKSAGAQAIAKSGGSMARANTKAVAKRVGIDALLTVGANLTMAALKDNPKARIAVAAGATVIKGINMAKGVNEVRGISSNRDD